MRNLHAELSVPQEESQESVAGEDAYNPQPQLPIPAKTSRPVMMVQYIGAAALLCRLGWMRQLQIPGRGRVVYLSTCYRMPAMELIDVYCCPLEVVIFV